MSYSSNSDIQTRLGSKYVSLTDDSSPGMADETRVTQARQFAEAEVDSYLARRYAVPVDTAGEADLATALKAISVDLAIHRLYERRPPVPIEIVQRRTAAIGWLEGIATGSIVLPASVELAANPTRGLQGQVVGKGKILTPAELADF
jgi:phage gp36-like protein